MLITICSPGRYELVIRPEGKVYPYIPVDHANSGGYNVVIGKNVGVWSPMGPVSPKNVPIGAGGITSGHNNVAIGYGVPSQQHSGSVRWDTPSVRIRLHKEYPITSAWIVHSKPGILNKTYEQLIIY